MDVCRGPIRNKNPIRNNLIRTGLKRVKPTQKVAKYQLPDPIRNKTKNLITSNLFVM